MKRLTIIFFCLLVFSGYSYSQLGRTTPYDLPVWSAYDTLRAGSSTDTSNSNTGLNNISLKINGYFNRWFDRSTDSLRNIKRIRFANGLILDANTANFVTWSGANLTAGVGLQMFTAYGLNLEPYGVLAGNTTALNFYDITNAKYVGFHAPDEILANCLFTLPFGDSTAGYLMKTNGSKVLGWVNPVTLTVLKSDTANVSKETKMFGYLFPRNITAVDSETVPIIEVPSGQTWSLDSIRTVQQGGTTVTMNARRLRTASYVDLLSSNYTVTTSMSKATGLQNFALIANDQIFVSVRSIVSGTITGMLVIFFYHRTS
jgi:hypothetical protein